MAMTNHNDNDNDEYNNDIEYNNDNESAYRIMIMTIIVT